MTLVLRDPSTPYFLNSPPLVHLLYGFLVVLLCSCVCLSTEAEACLSPLPCRCVSCLGTRRSMTHKA